jgi:ADP-ribose pyrophosphatase YjhB (NUDIX family)
VDRESQAEPGNTAPAPPAVTAVGAVVVDGGGRVLLVRRGRAPSAGTWTLPGGRVEPGESLEQAVIREVLEETAVRARVVCALGVVPLAREGFAYSIHEHLLVPTGEDAPHGGDDALEARWVQRADVRNFAVADSAVAVIDRGLAVARARGLAP